MLEVERGKHFSQTYVRALEKTSGNSVENCIAMWNELTFDCEPKPHRIW